MIAASDGTASPTGETRKELVVLLLLLLPLLLGKLALSSVIVPAGGDGGFYANVAQHVMNGDGLVTDLSVMNHGHPELPFATGVYPAWPLLYGYTSRWLGLHNAGVWIPAALYCASLGFLYVWARRTWPGRLFAEVPGLGAGHAAVATFGVGVEYFWFTSLPYSEGLAYTLLFVALWRSSRWFERLRIRDAIEMGLWAAAIVMARSQLVLFMFAIWATGGVALALDSARRRLWLRGMLVASAAFVVALLPWYLYIREAIPGAGAGVLLRFDQARGSDALRRLDVFEPTRGPIHYLLDRGRGALLAFGLYGKSSYVTHLWALPYGLLVVVWALVWHGPHALDLDPAQLWRRIQGAGKQGTPLLLWTFAAAGLTSIHLLHKQYWNEWNFGIRHALTSYFAFFLCLMWLARRREQALRTISAIVMAATLGAGLMEIPQLVHEAREDAASAFRFPDKLVNWINREAKARAAGGERLAIATRGVQLLWRRTPNVGYHLIYDHTNYDEVRAMVDRLGVHYFVLRGRDRAEFNDDDSPFHDEFEAVEKFGKYRIYALRR